MAIKNAVYSHQLQKLTFVFLWLVISIKIVEKNEQYIQFYEISSWMNLKHITEHSNNFSH